MKQFLLLIACITLFACNEVEVNKPSRKEIEETESALRRATGGSPLVIPFIEESDPSIFVIPVSDSNTNMVEKVYILDARSGKVNYSNDIYELDSIVRYSGSDCDLIVRNIHGKSRISLDDPLLISDITLDVNEINYNKCSKIIPIVDVVPNEW